MKGLKVYNFVLIIDMRRMKRPREDGYGILELDTDILRQRQSLLTKN